MSNEFQNFESPLGKSLGLNTEHLEFIAISSGFSSTETNIFTEMLDVLEVDSVAHEKLANLVTFLGKWDKKWEKLYTEKFLKKLSKMLTKKIILENTESTTWYRELIGIWTIW